MSYVMRREWGGRRSKGGTRLVSEEVQGIALHWPGMGQRRIRTRADAEAALRGWQDYHMDGNGWSDIAYQEAVDQLGNVYSLRGFRTRSAANGDADTNRRFGALLLILGEGEEPTAAMVDAVRRRVARFQDIHPRARKVVGHGDVRPEPTACPGPAVARLLEAEAFTATPPRPVDNHVTRARKLLAAARGQLREAAAELADTPPSRDSAQTAASSARELARNITTLLERMPRT